MKSTTHLKKEISIPAASRKWGDSFQGTSEFQPTAFPIFTLDIKSQILFRGSHFSTGEGSQGEVWAGPKETLAKPWKGTDAPQKVHLDTALSGFSGQSGEQPPGPPGANEDPSRDPHSSCHGANSDKWQSCAADTHARHLPAPRRQPEYATKPPSLTTTLPSHFLRFFQCVPEKQRDTEH